MKLVVDATPLLPPRTGIGTFTTELLRELSTHTDVQVSAVTYGRSRSACLPSETRGRINEVPGRLLPRRSRWLWRNFSIPRLEWFTGPVDVVHGTNYLVPPTTRAATVVSVHDVGFEHSPPLCPPQVLGHRHSVRAAIRKGAWIHTISEYVAEEVRSIYQIDKCKVVTVPPGIRLCKPGDHPAPGSPYILALGSTDRRKGLDVLINAFNYLAVDYPDLRLIHAGPPGDASREVEKAIERSPYRQRILSLGWVDDPQRSALLAGASVVACPSHYEGFGFVSLEAMLAGRPVVTTAVSAIPEVLGDAALYATPRDSESLASNLAFALTDKVVIAKMAIKGRLQAEQYTWEKTAAGLLEVYAQAIEEAS